MASIPEALALAMRHHQAGELAQAEQIYRQILLAQPREGNALHLLGMLAHQVGQHEAAVNLLRQAIGILPQVAEFYCNLACVYLALGRCGEAVECCQEALRLRPDLPEIHMTLGDALAGQQQWQEAMGSYRQALALRPSYADAHHKLGLTLAAQGQINEAIASIQEALRHKPDYADAYNNLGNLLKQTGRFQEAEANYCQAVRLRPDNADMLNHLGAALAEQGRLEEAEANYREALRLQPANAGALINLGAALTKLGRSAEGEACCREALRLHPDSPEALTNLGTALADQGRADEALACYQQAVRAGPNLASAQHMLGFASEGLGNIDDACESYEQAVRLDPEYAEALNSLAGAYMVQGYLEKAIPYYRKAGTKKPEFIHNLLLALHYSAGYDPEAVFAEHLRWAAQWNDKELRPLKEVNRDPERRLRIGYISADFREHVLGRYTAIVVEAHDRSQFEIFCYSSISREDARTRQIQATADHWRTIAAAKDDKVADLIRSDQIDILVDLAGHTGGNRLEVLARKPAPVQVTHCGYPATTGLRSVDYRLTDAYYDPPGLTERLHTEKLFRLPEIQICIVLPTKPDVGPQPAQRAGEVTFGSFNNPAKVTDQMIGLWCDILKALPGSRIVLKTGAGRGADERIMGSFLRHGVGEDRVTLPGRQRGIETYYKLYHDIDICLDTYPYTGCNTTADALWMGVPVVTLAGPASVMRQGASILAYAGLAALITETPAAYVETATRLARDLPRLRDLRGQLRERVKSTLGNVPRFMSHLEAAYRAMWRTYCGT